MSFYVAYAALIGHVALGAAQFEKGSSLLIALTVGAVWLSVLHIAAMLKGRSLDTDAAQKGGWIGEVSLHIAVAVAEKAYATGLAQLERPDDLEAQITL